MRLEESGCGWVCIHSDAWSKPVGLNNDSEEVADDDSDLSSVGLEVGRNFGPIMWYNSRDGVWYDALTGMKAPVAPYVW